MGKQQQAKPTVMDYLFASMVVLLALVFLAIMCGCSHNPAQFVLGEQTRLGFGDYGTFNAMEGLIINDIPRENTAFMLELDSEHGVSYDPASGTVKGVKAITRIVGPQVTGYLVELAEVSPDAAIEYIRRAKFHALPEPWLSPEPEPQPEPEPSPEPEPEPAPEPEK